MIKKLIRQMLTAQIISALTVSVCLLIDNIMISRFLGEEALASYGLANPLLLVIGAIGSLLAAGIQVACSKSLGRGSQEETNAGYSSAIAMAGGVSILFLAIVLPFSGFFARVLGAGGSGALYDMTREYLVGFSIGAPASMAALVLVPFLQMAGKSTLLIVAVLSMTVADVGLDLLNTLVFHWGMFGMGLASSLSYYVAMVIAGFYFLSKKCPFRFSRKGCSWKKIRELMLAGIPTGINTLASVILVFGMNHLLRQAGSSRAIAAFAVINTLGGSANCISTGIYGVGLTLTGILWQEEDRASLKEMVRHLNISAVLLGLAMGALVFAAAEPLISLFIAEPGETRRLAVLGFRFFSCGMIFCCFNNILKSAWLGSERVVLTEVFSLVEGAVLPLVSAALCSLIAGPEGVWTYFLLGEALSLLCGAVYIGVKSHRLPWRDGACLLMPENFGGEPENLMESSIRSMEEVVSVARQAESFCLSHGQSPKVSNHIALCIEEMAGNTIEHGFAGKKGEHHLSIRLLFRKDHWVLRFRDDGAAFDPLHFVPAEGTDALGLRLVRAMADEATYTYSMNMNNLTLSFRDGGKQG